MALIRFNFCEWLYITSSFLQVFLKDRYKVSVEFCRLVRRLVKWHSELLRETVQLTC